MRRQRSVIVTVIVHIRRWWIWWLNVMLKSESC